jgi:hypothetical protein
MFLWRGNLMINVNLLADVGTIVVALINIFLFFIIYIQFRDSRKPSLKSEIISGDKEFSEQPNVLEIGTLYLVVTNNSKNEAKKINTSFHFSFEGKELMYRIGALSHLNPGESFRIPLIIVKIRESYPELFEEHKIQNCTYATPKTTLNIDLKILVSSNPIIGNSGCVKIEDNYKIEMLAYNEEQVRAIEAGNFPLFFSWNKRSDDYYIYKSRKDMIF